MNNFLSEFDRVFIRANEFLVITLSIVMVVSVFSNLTSRVLTGSSISGSDDLARACLIWVVMLGVGLVLRRGGHVAVKTLQQMVPPNTAVAIRVVILVVVGAFAIAMVWAGSQYAWLGRHQTMPVLGVPYVYIFVSVPLGGLFLLIHSILFTPEFIRHSDENEMLGYE
ncbi:TRAP transporter small permease [Sneathiella sp. HT1-7]|uniref:TRAP transporter small permease n=1 Tax=Sneathiella sp. HT1-7 TaxID=2887192 RepID=UPI001D148BAA|nr:TRAP transporter small permease [Sneathiella sp. HT1-7]MCC3306356.1 TRAP transporter small permease [Sneathiella sp. HT1-7]